jgi:hypothetical protein
MPNQTNPKPLGASMAKLVLVVAMTVCLGAVLGILGYALTKQKPVAQNPPIVQKADETAKLTLDTLKNTEYYSLFLKKIIKLTNGLYSEPPEPGMASYCEVGIYKNKTTLGDLDNNGKDDAVVILDSTCGGSGSFRELSIILNQNGKPYYLTSKDLGDRVIINSINIEQGIITLDMVVHGQDEGLCCPTLRKIFKYRLSKNQLIEVAEDETADWKTYRNEEYGLEIKYPEDIIRVFQEDDYIYLKHSIPFEHDNPCNFGQENAPVILKELTDFNVAFKLKNFDLLETIKLEEGENILNFISDGVLMTSEGYIEKVQLGQLKGYLIINAFEGCGVDNYYFALNKRKTLVVQKSHIAELILNQNRYSNLKGIITLKESDDLFKKIFSTFVLK